MMAQLGNRSPPNNEDSEYRQVKYVITQKDEQT